MYPNLDDRDRMNRWVNLPQIFFESGELLNLSRSEAGIAIFFSNFWGKLILSFLKKGEFPKRLKSNISEKVENTATKFSGLEHTMDLHFLYFFKIFQTGDWGTRSPPKFFWQIFRMFQKTKTVWYTPMKLGRLKYNFDPLPRDFCRIYLTETQGTRVPQISQKVDGDQTGGHFQGPRYNKLQISSRNSYGNRLENVVAYSEFQFSKQTGSAALWKFYPIFVIFRVFPKKKV